MGKNGSDSKDDFTKYVYPIISKEGISHFIEAALLNFENVMRYMWTNVHVDFEVLSGIDYANVLNNDSISDVITTISENKNKYENEELLFLILRSMHMMIWKLDVLFLTHLEKCAEANLRWNGIIAQLAQNKLEGNYFGLVGMPYWLRNEQNGLLIQQPDFLNLEEVCNIEVVMHKANDIQAACRVLGENKIILLDLGLYTYLTEWCKLILSGYRIKKFCNENPYSLTEPVKTGAGLIEAIVEILENNSKVYSIPIMMNFDIHDPVIIKEIVTYQIDFILAHEYGHFIIENKKSEVDIELQADNIALEWIKVSKSEASVINKNAPQKLEIENNDIQCMGHEDKKCESVELLFLFYELYYYYCQKKGYKKLDKNMLGLINIRKKEVEKRYISKKENSLIEYAEGLSKRIKEYIDIQ